MLIGKTIKQTFQMTKGERAGRSWFGPACIVIEFTDGTSLHAQCDEEGNGPGAMIFTERNGEEFILVAAEPATLVKPAIAASGALVIPGRPAWRLGRSRCRRPWSL